MRCLIVGFSKTYLVDNILNLNLHLLLRALEALPQLIADRTTLQQSLQRRLRLSELHNPLNILNRALQQRSLQHRVRHLAQLLLIVAVRARGLRVQVQQAEVDVARDVLREPGLEFGGAGDLALAVDGGEAVEGADEDYEVGCRQEEAGPEGFGGRGGEGVGCAVECAVAGEGAVEGGVCCVVHFGRCGCWLFIGCVRGVLCLDIWRQVFV